MNQKENHAHAVIVPFPAKGHVNALMNLAQLISIRGLFVTFVNTESIHKRMVEASRKAKSLVSKDDLELEEQGWRIRFLYIPDGLQPNNGRKSNMTFVSAQKLGPPLESFHSSAHGKSPSFPPVTFIITDAFMSSTEQVASNMGVPRVIFWPLCAAASISQCYANLLAPEGHIPVNDLDDTLYPLSTGLQVACLKNIEDFMVDVLKIDESKVPSMCVDIYKDYHSWSQGDTKYKIVDDN